MGSAELGRELGDAGGPLVAGAVATATVPAVGIGVIAVLTAGAGAVALLGLRPPRVDARPDQNRANGHDGEGQNYEAT